jgi:hypothetical protein
VRLTELQGALIIAQFFVFCQFYRVFFRKLTSNLYNSSIWQQRHDIFGFAGD